MPRQMPKNGIWFSLAYRMALILPSMPRSPKPPGTSTPSQPASSSAALAPVTVSLLTHRTSTFMPLAMPAWVRASTTDR